MRSLKKKRGATLGRECQGWDKCSNVQLLKRSNELQHERIEELESLIRDIFAGDFRCTNRSCGDCEHDKDDGCDLQTRAEALGLVKEPRKYTQLAMTPRVAAILAELDAEDTNRKTTSA